MKGATFILPFATVVALGLTACGEVPPSSSQPLYRAADPAYAGLIKYVQEPVLKICYSDSTNSTTRPDMVAKKVMKWIDALREVSDKPLAGSVEIVAPDAECHGKVYVGGYSPAYTNMGTTPIVHINYSGWYGSSTVTLHELGHAFGLLDTYNGGGGSCQGNQPDSVMCWASYEDLQEDDIAGIRAVWASVQAANEAGIPIVERQLTVY
jgi:hypothetical protein